MLFTQRKIMIIVWILLLAMVASGCTKNAVVQDVSNLWVVMENSSVCEKQVRAAIHHFEDEHEGITINLEILPADAEEAAIRAEQLRVEIMAGSGPDIYLVPRLNVTESTLIQDVELSMRNDIFMDISAYYDADKELDKNALNTAIMDAGIIDGNRYVLPFRYTIPVVYANMDMLREAGFNSELLEGSTLNALHTLTDSDKQTFAFGMNFLPHGYAMNFLSRIVDYDNSEVTLTYEMLANYMHSYQELLDKAGTNLPYWLDQLPRGYYIRDKHWCLDGNSVYISWLNEAAVNVAIAQALEFDMQMFPVRTQDGLVVADITFFGAVGSNCSNPETAYMFLRMFLLEEYQWENAQSTDYEITHPQIEMISIGWPVRTKGCEDTIWRAQWSNSYDPDINYENAGVYERIQKLRFLHLSEGDLPILSCEIDEARFAIATEFILAETLCELNSGSGKPTDLNIDTATIDIVNELQWSIAEG